MSTILIETAPPARIIAKSSWPKKELADDHLEGLKFCEFGCVYCSSNSGLHLRLKKRSLNQISREQTGRDFDPHNAGDIAIVYQNLVEQLDEELSQRRRMPGRGKTLVYSLNKRMPLARSGVGGVEAGAGSERGGAGVVVLWWMHAIVFLS